ncbi:GIY-YIG nuclease family protein [Halovenus salina]|uniref:GIY-YIG nuclease family protein n=1 Tax=Halovenus salina TaxID=1510225 RepID=A0ABD5W3Q8_9EURY|nr:GIY-YIG nuclease family protein [Halovenus salina]
MANHHYVYVLECDDSTFYTGYTTDVGRRVTEHNAGDGAKYTAGRTPVSLRYVEYHDDRSTAQSREYDIKSHSREEKAALVAAADDRVAVCVDPPS